MSESQVRQGGEVKLGRAVRREGSWRGAWLSRLPVAVVAAALGPPLPVEGAVCGGSAQNAAPRTSLARTRTTQLIRRYGTGTIPRMLMTRTRIAAKAGLSFQLFQVTGRRPAYLPAPGLVACDPRQALPPGSDPVLSASRAACRGRLHDGGEFCYLQSEVGAWARLVDAARTPVCLGPG